MRTAQWSWSYLLNAHQSMWCTCLQVFSFSCQWEVEGEKLVGSCDWLWLTHIHHFLRLNFECTIIWGPSTLNNGWVGACSLFQQSSPSNFACMIALTWVALCFSTLPLLLPCPLASPSSLWLKIFLLSSSSFSLVPGPAPDHLLLNLLLPGAFLSGSFSNLFFLSKVWNAEELGKSENKEYEESRDGMYWKVWLIT